MKRAVVLFALFLYSICTVTAQHKSETSSKEEMKKMIEEVLKNYPPAEREKMRKQLEENMAKAMNAADNKKNNERSMPLFFPERNTEVLSKLPQQVLSGASLQAFVKKIYNDIVSKMTATQVQEVSKLAAGKKPLVLNQLACAAFLFQDNALAGFALAARACDVSNPGPLELNNLAAMLQLGGYPQMAIPLLQFINAKYPGSPLICNNLGQAYALLGDKEKTRFYLMSCIKTAPLHPEANNTMAHLEAGNNNMIAAADHVSNSLKGGFNKAAETLEGKLPAKNRKPFNTNNVNLPDAFNEYRITMPPFLLTVEDIPLHKATCDAWDEKLRAQQRMLMELVAKYEQEGNAQIERDIATAKSQLIKNPNALSNIGRPFSIMAISQANRISRQFKSPLPNYKKQYDSASKEVQVNYQKKIGSYSITKDKKGNDIDCAKNPTHPACEEYVRTAKERCYKALEATNEYLKNEAGVMHEYRRKVVAQALREFYFESYWGYLSGLNEAQGRAAYYRAALEYLTRIESLREPPRAPAHEIYYTACDPKYKKGKKDIEIKSKWEFECPVDTELPFFVGKIKFNCKEAGFSVGAGPVGFSFSQNFETHQYTLSAGIGAAIDKTIKVPGVEAKIEASISQSVYITYDGEKKMTDIGMRFGAGVSAGYGFGGAIPGGAGLDEDGVLTPVGGPGWSKDGNKIEDNIGYTISINSGFEPSITFTESKLKGLFPGEKQINPNVKLYKR